jgi:hypothetical protein
MLTLFGGGNRQRERVGERPNGRKATDDGRKARNDRGKAREDGRDRKSPEAVEETRSSGKDQNQREPQRRWFLLVVALSVLSFWSLLEKKRREEEEGEKGGFIPRPPLPRLEIFSLSF